MDSEKGVPPHVQTAADDSEASRGHGSASRSWPTGLALLLLSAICVGVVDQPCSGFLHSHPLEGELTNVFEAVEHFGTPYGAVLILVTIWINIPTLRSRVARTMAAAISAGLAADIVKLCVTRTRPKAFDFHQSIWSSFTGVFEWGVGGSKHQGFPSAHTAFAIAFAVMLAELFPKSRRWFLCLGALVALQRITTLAHFPSDVLAGAAVGWMVARGFLGTAPMGRLYDRLERHYFPDAGVPIGAVGAHSKTRLASLSPELNLIRGATSEPVAQH